MSYGIPYQGSKNSIAQWVVGNLPPAEVFVDLFAGGCAVTHAAMLSGKFARYIVNDLGDAPDVFIDAANGGYADYDVVPTRKSSTHPRIMLRGCCTRSATIVATTFGGNRLSV